LAASNAPVAALPGRLYAVGGRIDDNYSRKLASNEADDPPTNRWDQRAPLPTARSGIAAAVLEVRCSCSAAKDPPARDRHGVPERVLAPHERQAQLYWLLGGSVGRKFSMLNMN
jgi:hypothetical protein